MKTKSSLLLTSLIIATLAFAPVVALAQSTTPINATILESLAQQYDTNAGFNQSLAGVSLAPTPTFAYYLDGRASALSEIATFFRSIEQGNPSGSGIFPTLTDLANQLTTNAGFNGELLNSFGGPTANPFAYFYFLGRIDAYNQAASYLRSMAASTP